MTQIIKAKEKPTPRPPQSPILKAAVYEELQSIKTLKAQTEAEHKKIITEAKKEAHAAREQALIEGANQAFAEAAEQAVFIFSERIQTCMALKGQLQELCNEISQKILGGKLTLPPAEQDKILEAALFKIRARHKLKIQMANTTPLEKMKSLPDFEVEAAHDLPSGFLRIITEAGSALWEEQLAVPQILSVYLNRRAVLHL